MLEPPAAGCTSLAAPSAFAGALLGRVICNVPPLELAALIRAVVAGQGINLDLRI
jgi:hypothetical protein